MPRASFGATLALSLALGAACALLLTAPAPAPAAEYSPLNQASTYSSPGEAETRPGGAPENQARFLMASLADRQRLVAIELEMQALGVQPNPDQERIAKLDREASDLRGKLDKMASDMGGYIPVLRHRAGDCEKPGQNRRDRDGMGRGRGGQSRTGGGW